jgi:hypothetical protein
MPVVPPHSVFSHLVAGAPSTVPEPRDHVVPEDQRKKNAIGDVTEVRAREAVIFRTVLSLV